MPTSAIGTSPTNRAAPRSRAAGTRAASSGFTLIEILVVLVIIGVITAGILLSVNITGRDRELEKESDRLLVLFNYAREQAELQTREYGVMFQDDGYEFLTYDPRRAAWRTVFEDDALAARHLPDGLGFTLSVEARPVVLARPKDSKDKTPQVMIFSNGDLTTFSATLEREGGVRSVTLTQDEKGQVVLRPLVEQKP
ncbi:MAG: type II secretion system minor pseudopilin GspH [Gammaproteobacteria bacterium]|nr:type II secretion system minor pseudopilin GspH [Gammaproteobacteria bacterium]